MKYGIKLLVYTIAIELGILIAGIFMNYTYVSMEMFVACIVAPLLEEGVRNQAIKCNKGMTFTIIIMIWEAIFTGSMLALQGVSGITLATFLLARGIHLVFYYIQKKSTVPNAMTLHFTNNVIAFYLPNMQILSGLIAIVGWVMLFTDLWRSDKSES
jgi:hypothetical protein